LLGIQHAVYLASLCAFAQGFALLRKASEHYAWELNLLSIAKAYQGSSLIRSEALFRVIEALERKNNSANLLTDPYFKSIADGYSMELRDVAKRGISIGLSTPCLCGTVHYLDSYRAPVSAAGINTLAWDYILGEGFERTDKSGLYQGDWNHPDRFLQSDSIN
jgi:6-phosphogluconate dehydrogenase